MLHVPFGDIPYLMFKYYINTVSREVHRQAGW